MPSTTPRKPGARRPARASLRPQGATQPASAATFQLPSATGLEFNFLQDTSMTSNNADETTQSVAQFTFGSAVAATTTTANATTPSYDIPGDTEEGSKGLDVEGIITDHNLDDKKLIPPVGVETGRQNAAVTTTTPLQVQSGAGVSQTSSPAIQAPPLVHVQNGVQGSQRSESKPKIKIKLFVKRPETVQNSAQEQPVGQGSGNEQPTLHAQIGPAGGEVSETLDHGNIQSAVPLAQNDSQGPSIDPVADPIDIEKYIKDFENELAALREVENTANSDTAANDKVSQECIDPALLALPQDPATSTLIKGKEVEQLKPAEATLANKRTFNEFFPGSTQYQPQVASGVSTQQGEFKYNDVTMDLNRHSQIENTLVNQSALGDAEYPRGFDLLQNFINQPAGHTQNMDDFNQSAIGNTGLNSPSSSMIPGRPSNRMNDCFKGLMPAQNTGFDHTLDFTNDGTDLYMTSENTNLNHSPNFNGFNDFGGAENNVSNQPAQFTNPEFPGWMSNESSWFNNTAFFANAPLDEFINSTENLNWPNDFQHNLGGYNLAAGNMNQGNISFDESAMLNNQISNLTDTIAEQEKTILALRNEKTITTNTMADGTSDTQIATQVLQLQQEISNLQEAEQERERVVQSFSENVEELKVLLRVANEENESLRKTEEEVQTLKSQLDVANAEIQKHGQVPKEVNELKQNLVTVEEESQQHQKAFSETKGLLKDSSLEVERLAAELKTSNEKNRENEETMSRLQTLQENDTNLQGRVSELEGEVAKLKTKVAEQRKEVTQRDIKLAGTRKLKDALKDALKTVSDNKDIIDKLQRQVNGENKLDRRDDTLKEKVAKTQATLDGKIKEVGGYIRANRKLQEKLDERNLDYDAAIERCLNAEEAREDSELKCTRQTTSRDWFMKDCERNQKLRIQAEKSLESANTARREAENKCTRLKEQAIADQKAVSDAQSAKCKAEKLCSETQEALELSQCAVMALELGNFGLEIEKATLKGQNRDLETEKGALPTEKETLERAKDTLQNEKKQFLDENERLKTEIQTLKSAKEELEANDQAAQQKAREQELTISKLEGDMGTSTTARKDLETRISIAERDLGLAREKIEKLEKNQPAQTQIHDSGIQTEDFSDATSPRFGLFWYLFLALLAIICSLLGLLFLSPAVRCAFHITLINLHEWSGIMLYDAPSIELDEIVGIEAVRLLPSATVLSQIEGFMAPSCLDNRSTWADVVVGGTCRPKLLCWLLKGVEWFQTLY